MAYERMLFVRSKVVMATRMVTSEVTSKGRRMPTSGVAAYASGLRSFDHLGFILWKFDVKVDVGRGRTDLD